MLIVSADFSARQISKGGKALIPIYNIYCAFEVIGTTGLESAVTYIA